MQLENTRCASSGGAACKIVIKVHFNLMLLCIMCSVLVELPKNLVELEIGLEDRRREIPALF